MLQFYYNPISPNARRVWLTLLEKGIAFEPILMNLDGDQLQENFLTVNPFHHIPVVVDDGLRIVESLAIMDYLEAKYPQPTMLPSKPQALAKVRMVQHITANELFPKIIALIYESADSPQFIKAIQHIDKVLQFFTEILDNSLYFGSEELTLADIVAGTAVLYLPNLGVSLSAYLKIYEWSERLMQRPVWQKTKISPEDFEQFKRRVRVLVKMHRRELVSKNKSR
ncbi:glutathione S-transferase family protein [Nostoc sp. FACHB-152]|uniref:glutathione S-transferase family protein n=1 Tax=unclassified Nostoc TaxID=2593658 RepID=UPI00168A09F4|nr:MULTISPECIES: glutathione S-transferase family protein [unclassified Nostoc]MBD2451894.1 glutathione S-transferase family protein [Nostoc sp. FACHB-152]MBD2472519.1 glutathione S-transferase family protein [Nostoc sp. FACHB-145]